MILVAFISRSSFTPKILKSSWSFFFDFVLHVRNFARLHRRAHRHVEMDDYRSELYHVTVYSRSASVYTVYTVVEMCVCVQRSMARHIP